MTVADLESAYRLHAPALRGYLRRRLPRPQDAEDLCQESFSRVLEMDPELRDPSHLRAYLMRTAHNLLANHLRRPRLERAFSEFEGELELGHLGGASLERTEAGLELRELEEHIARALARIPQQQAQLFRRAVLQREPYASLAAELGISVGSIKASVFRTRRFLAEGLE